MYKGYVYEDEPYVYHDKYSGCKITRLTNHLGHSNHLYFTDPCWFNDGRSFVFTSDRGNHSDLFRYDLDNNRVTQLTELSGESIENERVFDHRPAGAYSVANQKHYFWWQNALYELDVDTCEERLIYQAPPNKVLGIHGITSADGRYVCNMMRDKIENNEPVLEYPYSYFPTLYPGKPRTQIIRVEIATGKMEVIHEDYRFMTHVNLSPTQPQIMTFCHEGPWHEVEQRIWGLNIETGDLWKIRPQDDGLDLAVGHEYWFSDGEHIGYHGRPRDGEGDHVFGYLKWDNSNHVQTRFPYHSWHFASNDYQLIVGDGSGVAQSAKQPFIQLFKWDGEQYIGPKILAVHRSTFNGQHAHCHPRFTPSGSHILYTSDVSGYSNMYLVEVKDFDELPDLDSSIKA